jgi:DNA invertase Pin-like site-specific DNA recombinase
VASEAKTDRPERRRALDQLDASDVLVVTRLARSTRDFLNTLAAITGKQAGFVRSVTRGPTPPRHTAA